MVFIDGLQVVTHWIFRQFAQGQYFNRNHSHDPMAGPRSPSARWLHALWLVLIIRLLLPAGFESSLSLYNVFDGSAGKFEDSTRSLFQPKGEAAAEKSADHPPEASMIRRFTAADLFSSIWILGALAFALVAAIGNLKCRGKMRDRQFITETGLLRSFSECRKRMRIRAPSALHN